ncbi:phage minor head protein [Ancylobacter sp. TS-1]|uniref:phage head morphogenesis protein n=1 Tax=Ancylobacter sp. TS-1 TaxID=1850374 RepID=UPI001265CFB4|nr:phage minor head protein [Ancylobacter sp. TS-1]QFR32393.1 hypothetical protein GBB76_04270 [Ancylobacter sp. TS-1]
MSATEALSRLDFLAGLISLAAGGRVERGFPTPPEVLDYFRERDLAPHFSWLDVWGEEHAHAFTVAGVLEERILAEFRAAIDQALANGTGFDTFREELQRRLTPLGWWGPRRVLDPDGAKVKTVDFTQPKRLRTTFWSNVRAARAAGQWDRIQRTKRALPYILYVRTTAGDPRPEHLRYAGIILPVDHPFWRVHFPPNGWGCKCAVRQISTAQAERLLGRTPGEDGDVIYRDTPPEERVRVFINKRTGVRSRVPEGIDPGWHTNPGIGRSRTLGRILQEQLDDTPAELAAIRVQKIIAGDGFLSHVVQAKARGARRKAVETALRAASRPPELIDSIEPWAFATQPIAILNPGLVRDIGAARHTVVIDDRAIAHNMTHHLPAAMWRIVQIALDGNDIWRRPEDGATIALAIVDGRLWFTVLRPGPGGVLEVSTMFQARGGRDGSYARKQLARCQRLR